LKIIFLDIDGVLNSKTYYKMVDRTKKDWNRFNPLAVEMIKRLIEEFKSSIVISSTWRYAFVKELKNELIKSGMVKYLHKDWKTPEAYPSHRGEEINLWLDNHPEAIDYVIIDDDKNILEEQKNWFIRTDINEGMTEEHYYKVRQIFQPD
jgi:hypothetical protein